MDGEVHRDLGKHDAQIEALQVRVDTLHADLSKVLAQLQQIQQTLAEARGGWKTMMAAAGLAGAVAAGLLKAAAWWTSLPGGR